MLHLMYKRRIRPFSWCKGEKLMARITYNRLKIKIKWWKVTLLTVVDKNNVRGANMWATDLDLIWENVWVNMQKQSNFVDYPILGKINVNQAKKCKLHMLLGYTPSLIQVKNEA